MKFNPKKYQLFLKEVWYLRYIARRNDYGLRETEGSTEAAVTERQKQVKELPWSVYLLLEIHNWICRHCKRKKSRLLSGV
jgi:hypothetical protein